MNPGIMPSPAGYASPTSSNLVLFSRIVLRAGDIVPIPAGSFYDIIAVGAGASGGAASNLNGRACGGGGPGISRDWGRALTDFNLTAVIGLGGLQANAATGTAVSGNPGGLTTVRGVNINLNITGALPGQASLSAVSLLGGLGGIASGGKLNRNGSRGGNITNLSTGQKATGGGSINLFGKLADDVSRGGDITNALTGGQITGGGGTGGRGGDNPSTNSNTAGGGAGGPASDGATIRGGNDINGAYTAPNTKPSPGSVSDILTFWPSLECTASGAVTGAAVEGAGSAGLYASVSSSVSGFSAAFGGTGGVCNNSTGNVAGGIAALGGGSGGAVSIVSYAATSGKAGDGVVIISLFKEQR